jgi:type I restriction enzyme S subunit
MGNYDIVVGSDAAILRHSQNGIYISYYTQTKAFYVEKEKYANGFKVTHISAKDIERIPIMLPPLELQQSFAAQIEAIEQQKALIRKSLDETRILLAARMQYYFE